jgi:hypothetical protein
MPSPRNRIKLTGDTHLPDVEEDSGGEAEVLRFEPAEGSERTEGSEGAAPSASSEDEAAELGGYLEVVREQVRQRPVAALAGAFVLGLLLARI